MNKQAVINRLVAAYRSADAHFDEAQRETGADLACEFSRIIGRLQGDIQLAARELGFDGQMRIKA